ncbi:2-oxoacid:acceptor oxidoreductase subunit alpha [Candidatus Roizmanbacteria bacterium]|nr:2-oxoacid:acceptor oxidoreductase subunit alpha [Candidatus Roizmanbacteria bacterium]
MRFTWKIGGEAGFGILTSGLVFSKIANRLGYFTFDYIEYPSLIRGGHNALEIIVSDEEVHALKEDIDYLVCLNQDTYNHHKTRLTPTSYVLYDSDDFSIAEEKVIKISVPLKKILADLKGQPVMKNTIAMGATMAMMGSDLAVLNNIIEEQFGRKGQEIVDFNKKLAELGYDHVNKDHVSYIKPHLQKRESEQKLVVSGNDAFCLGSIIGDCRMYCAYPMTPSSTVLTTMASWQQKAGIVVRHAEDEISVINTALGSSFAGIRSAVGTSGGGFALMVESVSFAGIAEMPIVIFLAQRAGPATGMPTWTEQGDLLFACHAGHGEFPKIVLAPGDVNEMVELTAKAFNLADIYQTPVIVMSDMFLSESHKSLAKKSLDGVVTNYKINRGKTVTMPTEAKYLRYKVTPDGISERLIPGAKGFFYQANSYEHIEDGHTTEESELRKQQVEKRNRKWDTYLANDFQPAKVYGDIDKSDVVFVSWGSMKGPILESQKMLKGKEVETAFIHFNHLYPLDKEKIAPLFKSNKRYILVENNSHAQFGKLLLMETGIEIKEKLLKYDGRPFWPEEIVNKV